MLPSLPQSPPCPLALRLAAGHDLSPCSSCSSHDAVKKRVKHFLFADLLPLMLLIPVSIEFEAPR